MTAEAVRDHLISPEDYLSGELRSPVKHEFLNGVVYAMAGANNRHNKIAVNLLGILFARLRGGSCQPYNSDTKVRIRLPNELRFYYPDVHVTCEPNPEDESFQDRPVLIIEVISKSTRRIDEGEKKVGYLSLASLELYLLVDSSRPHAVGYRRGPNGFEREAHSGLEAVIGLGFLKTELSLAEVYDRVLFDPEDMESDPE